MARRFVVMTELPNTGFMQVEGVYDNGNEACGAMVLAVVDYMEDQLDEHRNLMPYHLSGLTQTEGETGYMMIGYFDKEPDKEEIIGYTLFLDEEEAGNA